MSLFSKPSSDSLFAVDLSSSSVKILQLARQANGGFLVEKIGHGRVNRTMLADKAVVNNAALAEVIEATLKSAGVKSRRAAAAMPSSMVTHKVVTMPSGMSILEQEDFMQLEAGNHLPFPVEEVRLDFDILGPSKDDPKTLSVLLVASKNVSVQERVDAVESAGVTVDVLDVEDFAVVRAMNHIIAQAPLSETDGIEVVVDLGHEFTTMNVIKDGQSIYTREQTFGIKQLVDEVGRRFGLSPEEAAAGLIDKKLPIDYVETVLPQYRQELANQINRLIQFFFAATSYNRIHRIWLAGGGAGLDGLIDELQNVTGVVTRTANPFSNMKVAPKGVDANYLQSYGPAFLVAFGLAIRED